MWTANMYYACMHFMRGSNLSIVEKLVWQNMVELLQCSSVLSHILVQNMVESLQCSSVLSHTFYHLTQIAGNT